MLHAMMSSLRPASWSARTGLFVALLGLGCSDLPAGTVDAGTTQDVTAPQDLGPLDTGTPDVGTPNDLGPLDTGTPDTGTPNDLGPIDTGTADAGTPDVGTPDVGTPTDTGTPTDAGPSLGARPVGVLRATCTSSDQLNWYTSLLNNAGVPYEVVPLTAETPLASLTARALVLGCSVAPSTLELEDWSTALQTAVRNGSWIVLDGPAQQALVSWGLATLVPQDFFQSTGLSAYYLEAAPRSTTHLLLRDLPTYRTNPQAPPPPFEGSFLLGYQPPDTGMPIPFVALAPRTGVTDLGPRYLQITLHLGGVDSSSDTQRRCAELPYLCNRKRGLQIFGRDIPVYAVGQGRSLAIENAPYRRGIWEWGPVAERLHLNALRWARGEIR